MNLVTGGSGFIGINIVRRLLEGGGSVRVLDIVPPEVDTAADRVEYRDVDIRDRDKVIKACEGVENIYHIVSLVPISKAGRVFWDVNVGGTRNVLEGALKFGAKKIIHMSSSAVYDLNQKNPLDESSPIKPMVVYGQSKYDGEKVCLEYRKKGLDITIVRPRTVVGPERLGIYQILFDWIRRGKRIYIIGSGENKIQFVHVKDLVDAMILMAQKTSNDVFNIGTDVFGTLREDLRVLIDYAGTSSRVVGINPTLAVGTLRVLDKLGLSPLADWHYLTYHKDFYFDVSKAKQVLGWKANYSNTQMLIEAYQWYIDNLEKAQRQVGTTHRRSVRQRLLRLLRDIS